MWLRKGPDLWFCWFMGSLSSGSLGATRLTSCRATATKCWPPTSEAIATLVPLRILTLTPSSTLSVTSSACLTTSTHHRLLWLGMTGGQMLVHLCLFRPDRVKGFIGLSVPYFPRNPQVKPTERFQSSFGDGFYISQLQEPGRAETAFSKYACLTLMKKFLLITKTDLLLAPPGIEIVDHLGTPPVIPEWITEEELQVYAEKFQSSGFTGPINYYRAMDL